MLGPGVPSCLAMSKFEKLIFIRKRDFFGDFFVRFLGRGKGKRVGKIIYYYLLFKFIFSSCF